jgi:hypothetical protein
MNMRNSEDDKIINKNDAGEFDYNQDSINRQFANK